MDNWDYKERRKKIKVKERQFKTRLKNLKLHDVSLLESSSFETHLTSMDAFCSEITDQIDELIIDIEEENGEVQEVEILENISNKLQESLEEGKKELLLKRKDPKPSSMVGKIESEKEKEKEEHTKDIDQSQELKAGVSGSQALPNVEIKEINFLTKKKNGKEFGEKVAKRIVKKVVTAEETGEGLSELGSGNPTEVVMEIVLGSIAEQLGLKGTRGFFAAALTHYAVGQFAVLLGIATSPIKMDFSGITQAKILKRLEDLNKKVDQIIALPTKQALQYLREGFNEMKHGDFQEAFHKFTEVRKFATEAIALDGDFKNVAVCTKYLLFAETMTQAFSENSTDLEGKEHGPCFLPVEKLSEIKKKKMASYLSIAIDELMKRAKTKGRKKNEQRDQIDDVLKMIYNVLSVCKNLSNPNTEIRSKITFEVDADCVPDGEEDATVLQVGRIVMEKDVSGASIEQLAPFIVYLWRSATVLFVRREQKVFNIPLQFVSGSIVTVKLVKKERLLCYFGDKKENFERIAESTVGYPTNIQDWSKLLETAKYAKDMDSLPMPVYNQMQKLPEVYLYDLGIDINKKDEVDKSLLHYVACLPSGWTNKTYPIDCLVEAGAKVDIRDAKGQTPLMLAILAGDCVKDTLKALIHHYEGTEAINAKDNEGNNVLHVAASIRETHFSKEIVKLLLKAKTDATCLNNEEYSPKDLAHKHQNWGVKDILNTWLTGDKKSNR